MFSGEWIENRKIPCPALSLDEKNVFMLMNVEQVELEPDSFRIKVYMTSGRTCLVNYKSEQEARDIYVTFRRALGLDTK